MVHAVWLLGLSLLFVVVERLSPLTKQPPFRRGIVQDLAFLIFNSEYLGVLIGIAAIPLSAKLDPMLSIRWMDGTPLYWQFPILLITFDFSQWLIHNPLHRIPWLWEFHKLHHSIEQMDWIGNWRFHGGEVVVYRSLLYVPAALFGFSGESMFWYGIANTLVGHFAHSNTSFRLGPLRYLVNSPERCTVGIMPIPNPVRRTATSASFSAFGIGCLARRTCRLAKDPAASDSPASRPIRDPWPHA